MFYCTRVKVSLNAVLRATADREGILGVGVHVEDRVVPGLGAVALVRVGQAVDLILSRETSTLLRTTVVELEIIRTGPAGSGQM